MLNYYAHKIHDSYSDKSLKTQIADISGLTSKTVGKTIDDLSNRSRKKILEAFKHLDEGQLSKPSLFVTYASFVSASQTSTADYPHTLKFACAIDQISSQLFAHREQDNFLLFKDSLIELLENRPAYLSNTQERQSKSTTPAMFIRLNSAKNWSEIHEPLNFLTINTLYSFLALWDVEFCAHYLPLFEPRSIFSLVLPRLDPRAGNPDIDKLIPKRRDMFWYPVRQLIELSYFLAVYSIRGRWPKSVPSVKEMIRMFDVVPSTLVNWRDGTKKFSGKDFDDIWQKYCSDIAKTKSFNFINPPIPLLIATLFWQELFVSVSTSSKARTVSLMEPDYLPWWDFHFDELKAKGTVFGSTPWPTCLIK